MPSPRQDNCVTFSNGAAIAAIIHFVLSRFQLIKAAGKILEQFGRAITVLLLACLLLYGTTSKDWLHQFADHHDTVHTDEHADGRLKIEKEHHHCSFLSDILSPFAAPLPLPMPATFEQPLAFRVAPLIEGMEGRPVTNRASRGPPAPSAHC